MDIIIHRLKPLAAAFFLGLLVLGSWSLGAWNNLELSTYDTWFNLRGIEDPGPNIVIVAMDEKSIQKLGPLPWPRTIHARLLDKLASAKVVGIDVLFDAPTSPEKDQALAEAIADHTRVVLASMFRFEQSPSGEWTQSLAVPVDELSEKSAGIGFINIPADKGNTVRRVTVIDTNTFGPQKPLPSFSLAVAMAATGGSIADLRIEPNGLRAGPLTVPVDSNNQARIDFFGPARTFPTVSYADVLDGNISPSFFKDKIVLVGLYTPTVKEDYYENPYTRNNLILSGRLPVPGVEIHASAIKSYLEGRFFKAAPAWVNLGWLVFVWLLAAAATAKGSPWKRLLMALALCFLVLAAAYGVWYKFHYWIHAAAPAAMVMAAYLGTTVQGFIQTELERQRTRAMFSRYVPPEVVDEIMSGNQKVELGGEKREITVMFADIRGFTAYSEHNDPAQVISRLNEYLTAITSCILEHGGTLDKYLGDGVMAFFGAPVRREDHVERAIKSAVAIQEQVEKLNRKWTGLGAPPLLVALGINSGPAVVGNVGSPERMEYTAIGEDVNLASRMEALSKVFRTLIVVSERSYCLLPEGELKSSLRYVGSERVKGFSEPVACYTLADLDLSFELSEEKKGYK